MEPCKNCDRRDCPTLPSATPRWQGHKADANCRAHTVNWRERARAAESTLAQLAASGTGYSQQTVDAIVKERDALRARVIELKTSRYDGGDEHM